MTIPPKNFAPSARRPLLPTQAGYSQARNVSGGMNAWEKAGLPVLRGVAR